MTDETPAADVAPAHAASAHLAVHDLGGHGPTVLYAHATGFHAHCWSPLTAWLGGVHNVGYDARGHGDTPVGGGWPSPEALDWEFYGNDAALVARSLVANGRILGVGHSMGGAALLMAALREPAAFAGLVLYEPIVMSPSMVSDAVAASDGQSNHLANGARKRRSSFDSYEAAIANYSSKPPMNVFTPESIEAYVRYGFAEGDDGRVHLKCSPEHEARTYEAGGLHRTWDHLGEVGVPVWVLCGRPEPGQPSERTQALSERISGATYIQLDHLGHFGPMQAPSEIATLVADAARACFPGCDPLHVG